MITGFKYFPDYLNREEQKELLEELRAKIQQNPLFLPTMPGTGKPLSVKMTSFGPLGWVTDKNNGYRYQENHPVTGKPWLPIPDKLLALWHDLTGYPEDPECCLLNYYHDEKSKMGLHQDKDEDEMAAPVFSLSLGDTAIFRLGGVTRKGPTNFTKLASGDIVILAGAARHAYHGVDRILHGSSKLLKNGGRINLTLRRVTTPS